MADIYVCRQHGLREPCELCRANPTDTQLQGKTLRPPRWTVCYNIVSPESDAWVGRGWEFFNDEQDAIACYRRHQRLGNVPTKRPFYDPVDIEYLGVVDQKRLAPRAAGPRGDDKRLDDIRRWSRMTADVERVAAENHISPMESKHEKRLRDDIDYLLNLLPAAPADNDAESRRLLTECCYTIQQLAEQQAMPDNFYERTLQAVGRFLESDATKGDR